MVDAYGGDMTIVMIWSVMTFSMLSVAKLVSYGQPDYSINYYPDTTDRCKEYLCDGGDCWVMIFHQSGRSFINLNMLSRLLWIIIKPKRNGFPQLVYHGHQSIKATTIVDRDGI